MEFTEEWKSLWPVSSTFSAPLFIANKGPKGSDAPFGPLIFTKNPNSSTTLLCSPSIAPRLPPPYPELSLSRFLQCCHSVPSSVTSMSSLLGPELPNPSSRFHGFNALQLLPIPNKNLIILFFPVGENCDSVGFSLLSVKDGNLNGYSHKENFFQLVKEGNVNHHRITHLLVNPIDDYFCFENEDNIFKNSDSVKKHNNVVTAVGFLMACTNYAVDWYRIGIKKDHRQNKYFVCLDYLGCADNKTLRGSEVVDACWSPHLGKECLVLLENGDLLLFDVECLSERKDKSMFSVNNVVVKRMKVSLNDKVGLAEENGLQWFGCEFSWHPRIFIVCHHKEVFLVDLRSAGECTVGSLLKLEMLSTFKNDRFFTLSGVGADRFLFVVATRNLLLLCDVRKPLMPVLRWTHGIRNPRYATVFALPELRANAKDTKYNLASESGYCIMLGSFWDDEFRLFCCGPDLNRNASVYSEISTFCNSYYAWGHPSNISMSDSDCVCGGCVASQEFSKESDLVWIDWRQRKHLTLGFGILHPDLYAQLITPDRFGGFILIKLASSGKIETQRYVAAMESEAISSIGHKRKGVYSEDNLLYDRVPLEYDGKRKFQHLKLEFLNAYLKDKLAKVIVRQKENREEGNQGAQIKDLAKLDSSFHREICHKLKYFGFPRVESSSCAIADVMKDISLPTSVHEIALRSMFATFPINLLRLAFSTYADFNGKPEHCKEALEFLGISNKFQLPPCPLREPSNRCNKWSSKVYPLDDALVGPIIPPQFLVTLHAIYRKELKAGTVPYQEESFSALSHFKHQCDKIVSVVKEHVSGSDTKAQDEDFVPLTDDKDDMGCSTQDLNLSYHKASAFLENLSSVGSLEAEHYEFSTHIFRRNQEFTSDISAETAGIELFDVGCPVELKFNDCSLDFSSKELEAFKKLKMRELNFQKNFKPYEDYIRTVELKKE